MNRDRRNFNRRNDHHQDGWPSAPLPHYGDSFSARENTHGGQEDIPAESVTGTVKWFDARKGFGFLEIPGKKDAFLHASVLQAGGYAFPAPGTTIRCQVRFADKATVTEIESIDARTAVPQARPAPRINSVRKPPDIIAEKVEATVKFFNGSKGFGFLTSKDYDIFFHASAVESSGFDELQAGDVILVDVGQSDKGKVAVRFHEAP